MALEYFLHAGWNMKDRSVEKDVKFSYGLSRLKKVVVESLTC